MDSKYLIVMLPKRYTGNKLLKSSFIFVRDSKLELQIPLFIHQNGPNMKC